MYEYFKNIRCFLNSKLFIFLNVKIYWDTSVLNNFDYSFHDKNEKKKRNTYYCYGISKSKQQSVLL